MYLPTESIPEAGKGPLVFCYITDRSQFSGAPRDQEQQLLEKIAECSAAGVDFIQLREKDLSVRELERLACQALAAMPAGSGTRLLINSRADVALAAQAHGVHLPAGDLPASEARVILTGSGITSPVIGASVHSFVETAQAEAHGADFAVFAPVFEKHGRVNPRGLEELRLACRRPRIDGTPMPVLALGGITLGNAYQALAAGAAGIAGIRLFQQGSVARIVARLRALEV